MVQSKISSSVQYEEKRNIEEQDIGYESQMYEYTHNNKTFEIALGKQHYKENGFITYQYFYIVINEEPMCKIGVFEIKSNDYLNSLDKDGDMDLTKGNVLFFEFADKVIVDLLRKYVPEPEYESSPEKENEKEDDEKENEKEKEEREQDVLDVKIPSKQVSEERQRLDKILDDGLFIIDSTAKQPAALTEETIEDADKLKREFKAGAKNNWVENFMHNNHFGIVETDDNGDCFFATLREAFLQIGKKTTVQKLRAALAKEVTDDQFIEYRTLYLNTLNELQMIEKKLKDNKSTMQELKKRLANASKVDSPKIREEAKTLLQMDKDTMAMKLTMTDILKEFQFMNEIQNKEDFQKYIQKSSYWADTWAISTMERVLNVKVIILSEQSFHHDELDNVLQCGQLNDSYLEKQGHFSPEYYIITCYSGNHYELVTYKNKRIFKFSEVPYSIKSLIVNKCLERNSGPYYLIQEVRRFKESLGIDSDVGSPEEDEISTVTSELDLYDPTTVFVFHSKSDAKPLAGKGQNEKIDSSRIAEFGVLNKDKICKDWRRKLDDAWEAPFNVEGKRWNTVEHYVLGSQYKKGFPDFFHKFSLSSETDISKDLTMARAAASKSGKLKETVLRPKNIKPDLDYEDKERNKMERKTALTAKFSQNQDLLKVLKETKNAKLVHFLRGQPSMTDELLMQVRSEI